jgi:D-cysteine desulfhydrase
MLAALAARLHGLTPHLVFYGSPAPPSGNLMLDELIGARVHYTGDPDRSSVDIGIDALTEKLRAAGHEPCPLPRGGATPLGSVGYLLASLELADQFADAGLDPARLWLATGSCGTQAGLVAGGRMLGARYGVTGVSVSRPVPECAERVGTLAAGVAELLSLSANGFTEVTVLDGHIGPGYGKPSKAGDAAAELVARTEGVFLDPVFAAKAMGALVDHARLGLVDGPVVFLVSGGAPTLFAGRETM